MRIVLFILALAVGFGDDGSKSGRKGNEMYRNAEHEKAAALFSTGIAEQNSSEPGMVHAGLWNNLGASLHRMGRFDEARQAFGNAVSLAPSNLEIARSSYNAGNNAFEAYQQASQQQMDGMAPPQTPPQPGQQPGQQGAQQGPAPELEGLQGALEHYKRAMLADPENEDAKFNYEFVKRQLENQDQNQDQQQEQDQNNQDQQNNENQDQQQQNQDQQNQDQNQDQQQQNQDSQQQEENQEQQQQQQDQQQQQQPPPDPNKLSKEEAERILQALQNEEEELLREVMKSQSRPKKVEKDW